MDSQSHIYIPLCFYFIEPERSVFILRASFTFHYASTLSDFKELLVEWFNSFTFHYASTLSKTLVQDCHDCDIYIPLCFYFIETLEVENIHPEIFTFHYASTLSLTDDRISYRVMEFTFHYASTLSENTY